MLKIVDPNEDVVVCIDACKEGIGGILSRNGNAICYESRKLNENDKNLPSMI